MNDPTADCSEPGLWRRGPWTARVVKNDDGDGWAVAMFRAGEEEAALVGPWTMGRDKTNPKPLDQQAFNTLVKTASEVIRRHEHQARARLHREFSYVDADERHIRAELDIAPDEDDPHSIVACFDEHTGDLLRRGRMPTDFRLNAKSVGGFLRGE